MLFLCWGPSIHAKRRVQIFLGDPRFKVGVVSNYDYRFAGAANWRVSAARDRRDEPSKNTLEPIFSSTGTMVASRLPDWLKGALTFPFDVAAGIRDLKIVKGAFREFRPDVVFLQTLLYPCYLAYLLPRETPVVVTFWNGDLTWWAKWNGIERLLKKQIVRYGIGRAQMITVNSRSAIEACLSLGASREKIHLIRYPGADLNHFRLRSKEAAREKLKISAQKVVLCPRGFGAYHNSDIIVEAAARVAEKYPDTLFLFLSDVGGVAEWRRHLRRAQELGISRNLRWDGQVTWESMPEYYAAADVMVSMSTHDSLPNCMLEAMACGTPVVMGDIPQIREWVEDGVNGFLSPTRDPRALAEKIVEVLEALPHVIASFVPANLERVSRDADSAKNCEQIKTLVHAHARRQVWGRHDKVQ